MSWRDRDYSRGESQNWGLLQPLLWLWSGSLPLGRWFGVRVRVHASLVVLIVLGVLLAKTRFGFFGFDSYTDTLIFFGMLFGLVLMHEFGHIVAARAVGGEAEEVLLWPLGGLAFTDPPRRPWPTFVTVAGGPLVNVLVCIAAAGTLWFMGAGASIPWNPLRPILYESMTGYYLALLFLVSYSLLLFNLLPIFPLDGGQMLQTILWPALGYFRSMNIACFVGMGGAVVLGTWGLLENNWILLAMAVSGFIYCMQKRAVLREMGAEGLDDGGLDFSESLHEPPPTKRRHLSRRAIRRARKLIQQEQAEQGRIDVVLAKVSAHGIHSLTWVERRVLHKATERQRQRDFELSRGQ